MKANVKRPARFSFKTITEKKAKHLTLIFVAVLFLVIVVLALFPLLDREEERYEVTTYAMGSYVQQTVYGENREDAAVKAAGRGGGAGAENLLACGEQRYSEAE